MSIAVWNVHNESRDSDSSAFYSKLEFPVKFTRKGSFAFIDVSRKTKTVYWGSKYSEGLNFILFSCETGWSWFEFIPFQNEIPLVRTQNLQKPRWTTWMYKLGFMSYPKTKSWKHHSNGLLEIRYDSSSAHECEEELPKANNKVISHWSTYCSPVCLSAPNTAQGGPKWSASNSIHHLAPQDVVGEGQSRYRCTDHGRPSARHPVIMEA